MALLDDPAAAVQVESMVTAPSKAGCIAYVPYHGVIEIQRCVVRELLNAGLFGPIMSHELGHILGIGTIWEARNLIDNHYTDPVYIGKAAMREYQMLRVALGEPLTEIEDVPVEDCGGYGEIWKHWRASRFGNELMTPTVRSIGGEIPLSRVTVGCLEDFGYIVCYDKVRSPPLLTTPNKACARPNPQDPVPWKCNYLGQENAQAAARCTVPSITFPGF